METTPVLKLGQALQAYRTQPPRRARQGSFHLFIALIAVFVCWALWSGGQDGQASSGPAFVSLGFLKQVAPPVVALVGGLAIYGAGGPETPAILMIYFGAQTGMNLYMKNVLSKIVVDQEEGLKGIPIGFLLTAIQQFVAFIAFCCFLLAGRLLHSSYQVKELHGNEYAFVLCFSLAFAFNIGLNNFSLSLVAISINMIIRSCLPLATALLQAVVAAVTGREQKSKNSPSQWLLMLCGVSCAGVASYAKAQAKGTAEESAALTLGVIITVASIFAGASNMVLAGVMKLNPLDTTCYMALPAGLTLMLPSLVVYHPMSQWPSYPSMTDWQVLQEVLSKNPWVLTPVVFSGVMSFFFNILQYTLVHKLSPTHATFAGNFNKAATIALSMILGLETLPSGIYGPVFLAAVAGNIASFTAFSAVSAKGKAANNGIPKDPAPAAK
eukprot:CAMPEP_0181430536 /NCGR_PEP_ID=MMETSP1110-20121109/17773_1 /TAXON_ID=174948 /ORGANISM="Symbiodinium sp., Strain CCMP421" /LENGTH=439 /DNA_ID=CAMNT_0023553853 /DNA_START=63 /DNA_END=1382 /DNA_ORIENTATION=+